MCACVCIYVCMCMYACVCACLCMYLCMHLYVCVHACICVLCMCMDVYMYVYMCMRVHACVLCVCVACVCVYMCVHCVLVCVHVYVCVCSILCCIGIIHRQRSYGLITYQLAVIAMERNRKSESWSSNRSYFSPTNKQLEGGQLPAGTHVPSLSGLMSSRSSSKLLFLLKDKCCAMVPGIMFT